MVLKVKYKTIQTVRVLAIQSSFILQIVYNNFKVFRLKFKLFIVSEIYNMQNLFSHNLFQSVIFHKEIDCWFFQAWRPCSLQCSQISKWYVHRVWKKYRLFSTYIYLSHIGLIFGYKDYPLLRFWFLLWAVLILIRSLSIKENLTSAFPPYISC